MTHGKVGGEKGDESEVPRATGQIGNCGNYNVSTELYFSCSLSIHVARLFNFTDNAGNKLFLVSFAGINVMEEKYSYCHLNFCRYEFIEVRLAL